MKDVKVEHNKESKTPDEIRKELERARPSKEQLKEAIQKSIQKNKKALKILADR